MSMFERASGLAVRHLNSDQVAQLRQRYWWLRARLAPLMRTAYGTFGPDDLRKHLSERIGSNFEILMVHSSVNHMQPMYTAGPLELLRMLLDFVGPARTLAMPAFYFGDLKYSGTLETGQQQPRFDLRRTPSEMGLLTEMFRRWKGTVFSRHPFYRVTALGPLAADLVRGHERAGTPSGHGTPFDFMANHDTLILGIGKPFEVLTQIHHAEAVLGEEFPVPATIEDPLPMTLVDGKEDIPFVHYGRRLQWRRDIWKLRTIMDRSQLQEWSFHHVPFFATRAADVSRSLIDAARRGVTLYERP